MLVYDHGILLEALGNDSRVVPLLRQFSCGFTADGFLTVSRLMLPSADFDALGRIGALRAGSIASHFVTASAASSFVSWIRSVHHGICDRVTDSLVSSLRWLEDRRSERGPFGCSPDPRSRSVVMSTRPGVLPAIGGPDGDLQSAGSSPSPPSPQQVVEEIDVPSPGTGRYLCECGKTFGSSQGKAGHCHFCKIHARAISERKAATLALQLQPQPQQPQPPQPLPQQQPTQTQPQPQQQFFIRPLDPVAALRHLTRQALNERRRSGLSDEDEDDDPGDDQEDEFFDAGVAMDPDDEELPEPECEDEGYDDDDLDDDDNEDERSSSAGEKKKKVKEKKLKRPAPSKFVTSGIPVLPDGAAIVQVRDQPGKYECTCGRTFTTSQAKAGHCHYCEVHRAAHQQELAATSAAAAAVKAARAVAQLQKPATALPITTATANAGTMAQEGDVSTTLAQIEKARYQLEKERQALTAKIAQFDAYQQSIKEAAMSLSLFQHQQPPPAPSAPPPPQSPAFLALDAPLTAALRAPPMQAGLLRAPL